MNSNLTDAVAKQITAELDAMAQERKNRDAAIQKAEAEGYRIIDGGQISDGDEDYLCEYTDWRTGEVLYRGDGKDRPDPTVTEPPGHWHIDNLEFDISVTAEPVAGLPDSLVEAISYWVIENEEAARAWIQSGQGGSITVTLPAGLYD